MKKYRWVFCPYLKRTLVSASFIMLIAGNGWAVSMENATKTITAIEGSQQNRKVTGTVTDEKGETIIGANVTVKGSTVGVITDLDGNFALEVPADAVIRISYIGFLPQEVKTQGKNSFKIQLKEDTKTLDEVVVVGYGTQKKVNMTGSVSAVNVEKMAESRPINNLSNALAGMAAGVKISTTKNAPGDDNASIQVRGQGTLNNSSPLVIVDGVEGSLGSISPNDVETISVLKDAASAAIYGSRAANGVILITTKKGKSGQVRFDYNGYLSIERPTKMIEPVSDYATYMELMNEGYRNSGKGVVYKDNDNNGIPDASELWRQHANEPLLYPNTDAYDVLFGNTVIAQQHSISASGGTDKVNHYTSFTYLNNPGVVENTNYQRSSLRSNIDMKINQWFSVGTNLSGYYGSRNINANALDDVFNYAKQTTPGMIHRHPDGRYGAPHNPEDPAQNNVLTRLNDKEGENIARNLRARFFATISPLEGLSFTGSYTYDYYDNEQWDKPVFIDRYNFLTETLAKSGEGRTSISNKTTRNTRNAMDGVARYQKRFFKKLDLSVMLGASQEQYEERKNSASKYDLLDPALDVINGATGDASASGERYGWAMRSYFGRLNLGWADKYMVEFNLRADGSSKFASNKRWGYFPSTSVGWRVDQENFMKDIDWLSSLKLRGSYGSLGNNSIGNYDAISVYGKSNYILGNGVNMGLAQAAISNTDLTWESTYVANIGVDFGFLRNRLTGTFDVFNKRTANILIDLPAPAVHGHATIPKQNSAEVLNNGFEVTLGWRDQISDFSYYANANFTYITNKVTKFKGTGVEGRSLDNNRYIWEGHSINTLFLRPTDGIIQDQNDLKKVQAMLDAEEARAAAENRKPRKVYSEGTPGLGDILYVDANNDGVVDFEDRKAYGRGQSAPITYGFDAGFNWKGIDFSILLQGVEGAKTLYTYEYETRVEAGYIINKEIAEGRWHEGRLDANGNIADPAKFPRLSSFTDTKNSGASDFWMVSQDYLRVKNIQLGYTLPKQWTNTLKVQKLRVYCSLENFFTITSYPGLDPESGWGYPAMKQASFGVNLSF
ncbi:TonB-dependent receptor [Bacteroides sp.]